MTDDQTAAAQWAALWETYMHENRALRARAEATEQRAEAAEASRAASELRLREVGQILIAEIGAAGPTFTEDVARAAVARIQAAEAEAERLRSAIAETLRLADIYAGVATHNAEAEPETAGEAWRSPYMATMRELRRALGGAA